MAVRSRLAGALILIVLLVVGLVVPAAWADPHFGEGDPPGGVQGAPDTPLGGEEAASESTLLGATDPAEASQDEALTPKVTITDLSPEILRDQGEVTVKAAVSGGQINDLKGARIGVFVQADPFTSAHEARSFLTSGRNDGWAAGEATLTDEDAQNAVHGQAQITVSMPVDSLPLWNPDAWGPYGVTVRLIPGPQSDLDGVPQDRTILLWYGVTESTKTHVNVTLTDVAGNLRPSQWAALVRPGATLALSPRELRAGLKVSGAQDAEVVALPEAQASLSLLAVTGLDSLYALAAQSRSLSSNDLLGQKNEDSADVGSGTDAAANPTLEQADATVLDNLVLADSGWMKLQVAQRATGAVLTPPEGLPTLTTATETTSSLVLVDPQSGATVDPGDTASAQDAVPVLASWSAASQALSTPVRAETSDLNARQWVRSLTAISARLGEDPVNLWVNLPAPSAGDNPEERLSEILDAPWVVPTTVSALLQSKPSSAPRYPLADDLSLEQGQVREALTPLNDSLQQAQSVLRAAANPEDAPAALPSEVLRATAAALPPLERDARIAEATEALAEIGEAIEIVPSGTVNIVGRNAPFPVTLKNKGPLTLDVDVELQASDPRLSTQERATAVVPGEGSTSTSVPVAAVGTGSVNVTVLAKTAGGTIVGESAPIAVRVRAGWEGPGIWIIATLLALALGAGLTRTIRKGQRRMSQPRPSAAASKVDQAPNQGEDAIHSIEPPPRKQ